ncbi:MAG: phosphoribosylformimino-5-aminoimidazole carboxamide ribotide isomerase [Cellvibrionales bacterium TMED49]|nr:phosphoribosylformimino-5-aminoimidazole carboxamide ribotide isomerase [Porticoccaceae bacterium]OUU38546.1 MAG: phosphoribosylformimino-5-aminoimidazole carboxamide ribotide isomerase [Cellvibrionales bacterium TMED49]
MTCFRPCIDLHEGKVRQIVGSSLLEGTTQINHTSDFNAAYFASLYREKGLSGGHVISLGNNNQEQVMAALGAYRGGLQYGGGVTAENAQQYLEAGASHVIATSYLIDNNLFCWDRLERLKKEVGQECLVIDLSCRKTSAGWVVASNRWQTLTQLMITEETILQLQENCHEFLIHATDVEGKQSGMDEQLIKFLGDHCDIPTTYAGGANSLSDLDKLAKLSNHRLDLTIGTALDIFGGYGVTLEECISWNRLNKTSKI